MCGVTLFNAFLPRSKSVCGFTLFELSIVLVIIRLIAGGVMLGRDLIEAAQIRQQIVQIEQFTTAVHAFRLKFDAVPGDFNRAERFFGRWPLCPNMTTDHTPKHETCNGNGDGLVMNGSNDGEDHRFWQHLASANLIGGQYSGAPPVTKGIDFPTPRIPTATSINASHMRADLIPSGPPFFLVLPGFVWVIR